ncbi:flippase [bacterium]|jgi:O-antigen/teichoic acid export membrane protein|nr:flippase [bacterium]MBT4335309.1 flippase [bacterium]MBT4495395.1 flippase [bacterium]MBT4763620.1 flippase [bacterium]MBT5400992.1 flippase [bacterium]
MTIARSIANNTFWQIIGKIIGTFLGIITIGLLTRYLGQTGFGQYTTALAFMQFFGVLVDMGLYLICLREISANPEREEYIISNIFTLRIISAFIFIGGGALLIFLFPYPAIVKYSALIVSLSFFFMSLVQILTTVFQKNLKMTQVALAEVIGRIGFLIVIFLFIFYKENLPALMLGNVANTFIYFLILWVLVKKYVKITWLIDLPYWKEIITKAWPIALGVVLNLVYFRADTIILSLYKPASEVGIYGAPYKILEIIATFPHMFMGLVMPLLTAAWLVKNKEKFQNILQHTFNFFLIIIIPMILGTIPLSHGIMKLIAGDGFTESGAILPILIVATGLIFLGTMFTYTLVILDKQKAMLKYFGLAAVLALIGYFIFIPRYSYFGAAWVTVIVEGFITIMALSLTFYHAKIKLKLNVLWKSLLASIIMTSCLYYLLPFNLNIILLLLIACLVYFIFLFLLKGIDKKMINAILK